MTRRLAHRLRALLLVALLAAAISAPATAVAAQPETIRDASAEASGNLDDFSFESLHVDYALSRAEDGTSRLTVTETFVALFPEYDQNRGMRRAVPDSYQGAPNHPELVSITDGEGNPRPAETESEDGWYFMTSRADDFVHGRQTYVFTYTMQNVTRYFADTGVDEFYWDVNGNGWPQSFGEVTATVTVAPDLVDALTGEASCYVGSFGSEAQCETTMDASTVSGGASGVGPYQTVTLAVAFEQGTFESFDSSYLASPWGWVQAFAAAVAAGAVVFAGVVRRRFLRDAPGRPTIIAEYTPPPVIDALESAVLLGKNTKAIPAEVLEQAVVGSIRILEGERGWFGKTKLVAELVDPSKADGDGRMLLGGLFPFGTVGEQYEFGRQDTRLSKTAQAILSAANSELAGRGLRRRVPLSARIWPCVLAGLATVGVFIAGVIALDNGTNALWPLLLIFAMVGVDFAVIAFIAHRPLTPLGAETRDHLRGLEWFIDWTEADRIRMLQSPEGAERVPVDVNDPRQMIDLYEKLLPYAVVFGQEKKWAAQLAVMYGSTTPAWYYGAAAFDASSFSDGITSLSASSAASSSTSGGSSGGGSAGGGGGGGGGGGV